MKNKFKLPNVPLDGEGAQQKVMVVSFFGKSPLWAKSCKAGHVDAYCGRQIFQPSLLEDPVVDLDLHCDIEGYYDTSKKVIFLHLRGVLDTHTLVKSFDDLFKDLDDKGFLCVWADLKHQYARSLMLLFLISHVLILCHPTPCFDVSYINLFRALDIARLKLAPALTEQLRAVQGLPKDWVSLGRPCPPRMLFLCQTCPAALAEPRPRDAKPSIKKLEHALEDQIYNVLRKSRVITNSSANSLFAIPANQEFVYVVTERRPDRDWLSHMIDSLVDFCRSPPAEAGRFDVPSVDEEFSASRPETSGHSFESFLQQHVDQGFHKGFDDNVGRHTVPSHFEVTQAGVWARAAGRLHQWLVEGLEGPACGPLHDKLDTDVRFSEARCGKVLPMALATYQEGLPLHYMRSYHERKLGHALSVFAVHARGPLFERYAAQLERECERHWRAGRQMCEVLSLTGNPCTKPLHRGGGEGAGGGELLLLQQHTPGDSSTGDCDTDREATQLPSMEHSSGARYVSACNCGRKQGAREDPYTARAANHEYYQLLSEECGCRALEAVHFPVFQPSTLDFRAAQLFSASSKGVRKDSTPRQQQEVHELTVATPQGDTSSCSLAGFVSGQSGGSDLGPVDEHQEAAREAPQASQDGHEVVIHVSDTEDPGKDKSLVRQPSTTEYLPGMLHADSPAGLLPQFPSWSLVCLGPSSLYSHNLGLQDQQQAGVLGGSAYLLPWDVTVRLRHHSAWPAVGDQYRHKPGHTVGQHAVLRGRKTKTANKDLSEFVVKIFVGVEYECPKGHRFMCSAPDKVLKTTGSGLVKDNGNKVTASDMPLYFPCPCRSPKPLVAQLMRVHVVTPKAPIHVTLNPRVQPAPAPCPVFVTGCEQPVRLSQSAYWVLRLPFVYVGEQGPYVAPKEPVPLSYGRLLAGMYGITEVIPEDK